MEPTSDGTQRRREQYKSTRGLSGESARERRRREALEKQKAARRTLTDQLRSLVTDAFEREAGASQGPEDSDVMEEEQVMTFTPTSCAEEQAMGGGGMTDAVPMEAHHDGGSGNERGNRNTRRKYVRRREHLLARAKYYSEQFCIPEWMIDVPVDLNGKGDDLGRGWLVMARPEGKRCMMVVAHGQTVTKLQNGEVLHRFQSVLPHGSTRGGGGSGTGWSILDCIYHEVDDTYYVLDLLCWKGFELYDCTAEFRLFFLRSKFTEDLPSEVGQVTTKNHKRIVPLLYHDADPGGIQLAYSGRVPFVRDGLIFLIKQGYYSLGLSPLVLLWKDRSTCRYLAAPGEQQLSIVLKVGARQDGVYPLLTLDDMVVGHMTDQQVMDQGLVAEDLVRFLIHGATEVSQGGKEQAMVVGLQYDKKASIKRCLPDSWSRILFHSRLKDGGDLSITTILTTASSHVREVLMEEGETIEVANNDNDATTMMV